MTFEFMTNVFVCFRFTEYPKYLQDRHYSCLLDADLFHLKRDNYKFLTPTTDID
jgi:hypothetical protein